MSTQLTVGEVAARSGFAASALRHYEREGLLSPRRTAGNQRRYDRSVLRVLAFVAAARHVGLSLDEIRTALAALPEGRTPTVDDWRRVSANWRHRLDDEIAALEALRDRLDGCIGCGCLSLERCALSNPDDTVASRGPGARHLPRPVRVDAGTSQ